MQSHHFTSHDLDLLESYVHDCIQQLPKLPSATDATVAGANVQIPTRCSSYHTVCTNMLKEIVTLLSLFSPRLCRLIGQVWDLASLNVFVLLQMANTALQDAQQLRDQLVFVERFHAEALERQTSLTQRYEDEIARQRMNEQGLRAELQKVRQRANHLAVENGQLHLIVGRVLDAQQTMEAARFDSSNPTEQLASSLESDGQGFCEDIAAVGDAEERELFGVGDGDEDALSRIQTVHPIESYGTDFEQLFQALFDGEERNVRVLNEMDRFINSTAVALLWRYGSTEEEHQMMHRMLSVSTVGTQTDGTVTEKPSHLSARSGDHWESDSDDYELDPAVRSIADVEESPNEASWGFPRALALELLSRHLQFVDQPIIEDTKAQIMRLAPLLRSTSVEDAIAADYIAVDVFLALFATTWITYDRCLENKLRESFRHQLLLSSPFAKKQLNARLTRASVAIEADGNTSQQDNEGAPGRPVSRVSTRRPTTVLPTMTVGATAIATHSTPLELLTHAWMTLDNETLSSLDVEELESTFRGLLEAKQVDAKHHRRQSSRNLYKDTPEQLTGAGVSLGGVTEKEFVFHALQVLRRRRNNYGLRTNSRRPPRFAMYGSPAHEDIGSVKTDELSIPLESLKPGLTADSLAYVGK
ncbi:uncharacterized protein IUM83_04165 [Phytophthora cinnamomi]|uniref:uncharacterized protein n=1 Tax=Phytophthora cinnamomi TaxID=4785 RepID=UPI003559FD09|nr:hypothetical protein IUM83_04165 [Phytophthora cinnamomi]